MAALRTPVDRWKFCIPSFALLVKRTEVAISGRVFRARQALAHQSHIMPRLSSLLCTLAAASTSWAAALPAEQEPVATADVVIIGAGISGIAVARELALEHNITDFLILEARPIVGGRAYLESLTNPNTGHVTHVEKGCNWIQGPRRQNITRRIPPKRPLADGFL